MKKIVISNLNKYYNKGKRNELHVINNTSLEFDATGFVCLLGESGSGKTTLLNVMSGIDKSLSGSILIDNEILNCNSKKSEPIKNNKFGYVFQNYYMLDNETVYENLRLALAPYKLTKEEIDSRIDYVLKAVDMSKYLKRKLKNLSGGQAQRIAIARALVKSPDVIFADEPTGNLDEQTTLKVMSILKNISKTCLVIVATHERRIAEFFADRIVSISDGKIVNDYVIHSKEQVYDTVDDHNLYLQEYNKVSLKDNLHSIDIYQNDNEKVNLKIVCEHGKYYIVSDKPESIQVISKTDNIQAIDSKKPVMDMEKIDETKYDLPKPNGINSGMLSWKEIFNKVIHNTKSKSYIIMIIALILISIISTIAVGDIMTINKDDIKEYLVEDTYTTKYEFSKNEYSSASSFHKSIMELSKILDEKLENTIITPTLSINAYFEYDGFIEIENVVDSSSTIFGNFTYVSLDAFNQNDLIYGRMPEDKYEIVVDKWVLDSFMKEKNIVAASITKYETFLNKTIYSKQTSTRLTIVGICETNSKCAYIDDCGLINSSSPTIKVMSLTELKAKHPGVYDDITLGDDELLITSIQYRLNMSPALIGGSQYKIIGKFNGEDVRYVMSEEGLNRLKYSIIANKSSLNAYSKDENEVKNVLDEIFNSDNALYSEIQKYIQYTSYSHYEDVASTYYKEKNEKLQSRLIVTGSIFVMCVATLFITMKSHAMNNMNSTMVYRLLGLKKKVITRMYILEILVASIIVMIPSSLLIVGVLEFIEHMPASTYEFALTPLAYGITLISMFIVNILVGILPVVLIMRKTPAQLVSQYDI